MKKEQEQEQEKTKLLLEQIRRNVCADSFDFNSSPNVDLLLLFLLFLRQFYPPMLGSRLNVFSSETGGQLLVIKLKFFF
jgi:hypothetical protein